MDPIDRTRTEPPPRRPQRASTNDRGRQSFLYRLSVPPFASQFVEEFWAGFREREASAQSEGSEHSLTDASTLYSSEEGRKASNEPRDVNRLSENAEYDGYELEYNETEKQYEGAVPELRESKAIEEKDYPTPKDVEEAMPKQLTLKPDPPPQQQQQQQQQQPKDPNIVTFDGPQDPTNPKNWPIRKKWAAAVVVSSFTFISPVTSSMIAPALRDIGKELHITDMTQLQLVLSVFVLAYAVGPLILAPLSEVYGRVIVLQLSNMFFLAWNMGCGFAQTKGQIMAFRFLAGLGGSAPLGIGGGVLSDMFKPEERGKAIAIYSLAPMLGPAVGPIAGGFIAENVTWRWAFWSVSAVNAVIQVFGFWFLQETYAPRILKKKAQRLRRETGNAALRTQFETPDKSVGNVLATAMARPSKLLLTQPIIQIVAVYMALLYGVMYLLLSTYSRVFEDVYGESTGISGLNYIALGIGFVIGTQVVSRINDRVYRVLTRANKGQRKSEFRLPLMVPGSCLIPIGLFIYGWSAQERWPWIVANIGAFIFAVGTITCFMCMQTYIVDAYTRFAASGIAAAVVLRSCAGFGFPLFAPYMYARLQYGWGNSALGFVALGVGVPAPFFFWYYGEALRRRSPFAAGG